MPTFSEQVLPGLIARQQGQVQPGLLGRPGVSEGLINFGTAALLAQDKGLSAGSALGLGAQGFAKGINDAKLRQQQQQAAALESTLSTLNLQQNMLKLRGILEAAEAKNIPPGLALQNPKLVAQEPTSLERQLQAGGLEPGTKGFRDTLLEKAGGGTTVNLNTQVESATKKQRAIQDETRRGKFIDSILDEADTAVGLESNLSGIESNLDDLVSQGQSTGPVAPVTTFLNDLGAQLGLDGNINEASSLTQIEAFSNALAVPLTKQLGVNPTDRDFSIIKSTVARAGTSMQANFALVDVARQAARRRQEKARIVQDAQANDLSGREIRRLVSKFNKESRIVAPKPLPSSQSQLRAGERYVTNRGVFTFDGQNMVRVR